MANSTFALPHLRLFPSLRGTLLLAIRAKNTINCGKVGLGVKTKNCVGC